MSVKIVQTLKVVHKDHWPDSETPEELAEIRCRHEEFWSPEAVRARIVKMEERIRSEATGE